MVLKVSSNIDFFKTNWETAMKKRKTISLMVVVIFVFTMIFFRNEISELALRLLCPNIIETSRLKIKIPKGIYYKNKDSSIVFLDWRDKNASLSIVETRLEGLDKQDLVKFLKKRKYKIIEVMTKEFKGVVSCQILYVDDQWRYTDSIYIFSKNIKVTYRGDRSHYSRFNEILNSLEFLN